MKLLTKTSVQYKAATVTAIAFRYQARSASKPEAFVLTKPYLCGLADGEAGSIGRT